MDSKSLHHVSISHLRSHYSKHDLFFILDLVLCGVFSQFFYLFIFCVITCFPSISQSSILYFAPGFPLESQYVLFFDQLLLFQYLSFKIGAVVPSINISVVSVPDVGTNKTESKIYWTGKPTWLPKAHDRPKHVAFPITWNTHTSRDDLNSLRSWYGAGYRLDRNRECENHPPPSNTRMFGGLLGLAAGVVFQGRSCMSAQEP